MISKLIWIIAPVLLLSTVMLEPAFAASMRCGTHIISDSGRSGPDKYEVLKKCGEPTVRQGDSWIYEQGGTRRTVVFDPSGSVSRIG